ncbi:hypothetical protein Goari_011666, partial [Gossypium aridum]|nr:hypothetical protein [Gossypium aridum]
MVAVSLRLDLRIEEVLLEGDALSGIKKMNSCNEDGSVIGAYIYDAKLKSKGSKRYLFRHVPKDANKDVCLTSRGTRWRMIGETGSWRKGEEMVGSFSDVIALGVEVMFLKKGFGRSMKAGGRNNNGFWGSGRLPKTASFLEVVMGRCFDEFQGASGMDSGGVQ